MSRLPRRQRGVALIMVLLAAALATALAGGMMSRQSLMIERASHHLGQQQARSLALGAEVFAKQTLYRDWEEDRNENAFVDHPTEFWAQYAATLPVASGVVEVQVNDRQGLLNLNGIVNPEGQVNILAKERFVRLLEVLEVTSLKVEQVIDWIDANEEPSGAYGAEDGTYLSLDPPYRAANRYFVDVSELRLLGPMTVEDYAALAPNVTALPPGAEGLNINMAPLAVLRSFHPEITEAKAESLIEAREAEPFANVTDFLARDELAALGLTQDGLSVRTSFFDVATQVSVADRTYKLVSSLYRGDDGKLSVISRDAGEDTIITKERVTAEE
ncbi:type II secretion system minor pseudopilin GspK [Hydrocarboniclastica marina]|uniref:Type II secretion system protein K n=1 Tax=Hydrocarboniclastica marina TaxID=2259620 RepID=A0A4P7XHE2_9ALTE|nr:type II secretion system minor pseudopilin GspK [Hydrocarboniclastica marina]MAL99331.1 general secretion pathway protein GspK [Alteromonadaceae bacterium]QCF26073.1 general secretion pathway protein GspK [Hydrocarboniclastica marina]